MSARDLSAARNGRRAPVYLAALAAALLLATASAQAATVNFTATIDGPQEPTASPAVWNGTFVMDTVANTLTINVVDSGVAPLTTPEIAAHIHGFSGPGVPSGILFGLPPGSPKNAVWNFMEAQEPSIIAGLTYVNIHTTMFPAGEIRGQVLRAPSCGDGILDGGEACDDGNAVDCDGCSASCQVDGDGSACGGGCGTCDSGSCDVAPRGTCRTAAKSILILKDDANDTKDKLIHKWIKGEATVQADFGTPTGTTSYTLCIYTGTSEALLVGASVPGGSLWAPISTKGYKYKDKPGTNDGIQKVILKGGAAGKAKTLVKGKGVNLPTFTLGTLDLPVLAELVNDSNSVCFGSEFDALDVIKNDASQFKAKAQ